MEVSDREFSRVAKQLGKRIQQLRKAARMTQAELEEKTGLSDVGIHERGEKNPTLLTLLRFSKALGVSLKDLTDVGEDAEGESVRMEIAGLLGQQDLATQRKALEMVRLFLSR